MKNLVITLLAAICAGCAYNITYEDLTPEQKQRYREIEVKNPDLSRPYDVVKEVSGKICGEYGWVYENEALDALRASAAIEKLDAVIDVQCHKAGYGEKPGMCGDLITCKGQGIRYQDKS
ncbi:hypothetical protein DU002_19185 [Corallincola holothuriorum]|uniref:Uncharacterized protein n=1 Tax=Corallincola holothuriorum TaxID=2282215 RepID=A0A368N0U0_9GAMM|nr:hypothetical protein [Corallincola holothuriorum]RCU42869.1 hypothetical protein DU002_19185 [Corallincola holothuriorum]